MAAFEGRLYQLTWTSSVCFVYDQKTLTQEKELFYNGQGWGLTTSPKEKLLVFSDGSETLKFLEPSNLVTKRSLVVTDGRGQPVSNINELEWVRGEIWANIWMTDTICRIAPTNGKVLGWIELSSLVRENQTGADDVLNGIAYDPQSDTLWLTGKLWPKIFRFDEVEKLFFAKHPDKPRSGTPSPAR